MTKIDITDLKFKCGRCKHQWIIRKATKPKVCPRCKLPWDKKGRTMGWRRGLNGNIKNLKKEAKKQGATNLSELARIKEIDVPE